MIGAVLGNRYEILELIGTGGMANVYKAKCTLLNRNVAIKVLKEEFKDDDEIKKRFNIESQAVAGLSHTNIVSVFDVGTENDLNYIVMEYVEGITLKEYLKESGALVWNQAVDFAIQICSALQHAHRKGIIHRDIKPQNIMVTKDNVLKVMDFGIARAVSTYTTKIDNEAMGTAHYCSPEQAKGSYTDERSDIYSLGVVIYEMLTGHPPFESDSSVSVALKQIQEKPVPPTQIVPTIPASVETVVLKAMEKDAVNRFQAANTLLIELNWIKQTETAPKSAKQTPVIVNEEDKFATKKIDLAGMSVQTGGEESGQETSIEEIEEIKKQTNMSTKTSGGKKVKKATSKEDKTAVIAAIISAIVIVALLSFALVNIVFDGQLFKKSTDENVLKVPDVIGMTVEEAEEEYKDFKFTVEKEEYSAKYDEGAIIKQSPEAEEMLEKPYEIEVTVSKGSKEVKVPDIINLDIEEAKIKLKELEIKYEIVEKENSTIPDGIVISVNPGVGKKVYANVDKVVVYVSLGDNTEYVSVPDVIDKSQAVAEKMLKDAGLEVIIKEIDSEEAKGTVVKQSQPAGSKVEVKEIIIIYVSTGEKDEDPDDKTSPGVDDPSTQRPTTAKEITVYLPQDKEKVTVKVTLDGSTVYEKSHNCSEGSVSVVVRGSGKRQVVTYLDGVVAGERMLNFD